MNVNCGLGRVNRCLEMLWTATRVSQRPGLLEHLQTLDSGVGELSIIPKVNRDALQISRQRPNSRIPVSAD